MSEKNLIKDLLLDYDKKSRPVIDAPYPIGTPERQRKKEKGENSSTISIQQITVQFGLRLVQILDLDEMDQVLTTSMISLYEWIDYHLRWDPSEEAGISFVHIPTNEIWLPDIALYNYADERLEERRDCAAKVHFDGRVEWHPMAIYKSACEIKIKYFPFDKQVCWMKFGPWTYDGWRVNISYYRNMTAFDLEDMVESPEWHILNHSAKYSEVVYPCCPEPYVDITFWIWMQRSTAFYTFILILPCFLLSSLTLVLFWLPPETPAKMVLGMNIFVAFFLLMLLLEKQTPSASDSFPLIGQYYCLNMGIITLSTFLSVIVVNFHFRGDNRQEVPYWLKKLAIQHGSRLLFVNLNSSAKQNNLPQVRQQQQQISSVQQQQQQQLRVEDLSRSNSFIKKVNNKSINNNINNSINKSVNKANSDSCSSGGSSKQPNLKLKQQQQQQPLPPLAVDELAGCGYRSLQEFDEVLARCARRQQQQQHPVDAETILGADLLDSATRRRVNMLTKDVQDIVRALRYIQRLNEAKERVSKVVQEWRSVALVLDRLFFIIYVVTIALSIVFFFPKSGNEVNPGVIPE